MTFYIEACESGSMFPKLASNTGVYAMTASNASKDSWAAYCGSEAVVKGKNIGTCLGDAFSVNWMQDTEQHNPNSERIGDQYLTVKKHTTRSPVSRFG